MSIACTDKYMSPTKIRTREYLCRYGRVQMALSLNGVGNMGLPPVHPTPVNIPNRGIGRNRNLCFCPVSGHFFCPIHGQFSNQTRYD